MDNQKIELELWVTEACKGDLENPDWNEEVEITKVIINNEDCTEMLSVSTFKELLIDKLLAESEEAIKKELENY